MVAHALKMLLSLYSGAQVLMRSFGERAIKQETSRSSTYRQTSRSREQSYACLHRLKVFGCTEPWAQGAILSSNVNRSAQKPSVKNQPES